MATLQQLMLARDNAEKAGDTTAVNDLIMAIRHEEQRRAADPAYAQGVNQGPADVPGNVTDDVPWLQTTSPEPGVMDRLAGVPEAAATMATGATAGLAGGLGSMLNESVKSYFRGGPSELDRYLRSQAPEQAFGEGAAALTYQPRSQTGQQIVETVGELAEGLPPVLAPSLAQANIAGSAARGVAPMAAAGVQRGAQAARQAGGAATDAVQRAIPERGVAAPELAPDGLARAREVQQRAQELPVPVEPTLGQASGDFDTLKFESTAAKMEGEAGDLLRDRQTDTTRALGENWEALKTETGAKSRDVHEAGEIVDTALTNMKKVRDAKTRALYEEAEVAGEMSEPVATTNLIDYLNRPDVRGIDSGVLRSARNVLIQNGGAIEVDDVLPTGVPFRRLEAAPISLAQVENIRRAIGNATGSEKSEMRLGGLLRAELDADTKDKGGKKYAAARDHARKTFEMFEDKVLIRDIMKTDSTTKERKTAFERVAEKAISNSYSRDQLSDLKRQLFEGGEEGKSAWAEIKREALKELQSKAFSQSRVTSGERLPKEQFASFNKALTQWDRSGKLDVLFGKKGAGQLKTIRDVVKSIATAPDGTVNHSNTATILTTMMDTMASASTGTILPVATIMRGLRQKVQDKKTLARVKASLERVK